jgi:hypothetical protein
MHGFAGSHTSYLLLCVCVQFPAHFDASGRNVFLLFACFVKHVMSNRTIAWWHLNHGGANKKLNEIARVYHSCIGPATYPNLTNSRSFEMRIQRDWKAGYAAFTKVCPRHQKRTQALWAVKWHEFPGKDTFQFRAQCHPGASLESGWFLFVQFANGRTDPERLLFCLHRSST